jgi:hypothetical protein
LEKFTPNSTQLQEGLEHVAYEMEQLIGICAWMIHRYAANGGRPESAESVLEDTVYLEAFLVHVRVLTDFFERTTRSRLKDIELPDVLAQDYGFLPEPVGLDPSVRSRINQELAHLSYRRGALGTDARQWLPEAVARPLLLRCDAFAAHVLAASSPLSADKEAQRGFASIREMLHNLLSRADA